LIKTLFQSLKGTDWDMLTDFVSPVFFEVVPALGMASAFARIGKDFANKRQFRQVADAVQQRLAAPLEIKVAVDSGSPLEEPMLRPAAMSNAEKAAFGEMVLEIYFAQLCRCDVNILDLRTKAFTQSRQWSPSAIYYRWSPTFRDGIQKMYRGFYHDDAELFLAGLRRLDLEHAADIFKTHFGAGSQDAVTFKLAEFKKSFHAIFLACKDHKTKLHPDFFALGVYLVCLYENLESLGVPMNVRRAFLKAEAIQ
jgi:hypothetical protein